LRNELNPRGVLVPDDRYLTGFQREVIGIYSIRIRAPETFCAIVKLGREYTVVRQRHRLI
jgi:hypothetical protein